ncbi:MAG: D-alanine--D-alanine ligase family protein [Candidatus Nanopelagicaceae bacterium]|nr:D-alanine--D-alanine ligase family protein [Candidatus Nanopelagicaceae bacterium]
MNKIVVGILCGGRSSEHEISCISTGGILAAIDRERYEPVVIGITRTAGRWILIPEDYPLAIVDGVLPTVPEDGVKVNTDISGFTANGKPLHLDLIFPMLHGPYGEDGTIQGFCEIANIPYVGSGVLASAAGMDKSFAKTVFSAHGMKVAEGTVITTEQWRDNRAACEALLSGFSYPLFVKPARGGSSRGTTKVKSVVALAAAIGEAHKYDRKAMIEEMVPGIEVECAVLEVDGEVKTSLPGEIIIDERFEFYDFQAKYLDDGTSARVPANIPAQAIQEIQRLAALAFTSLGCAGLARVDFFYRPDGQVVINELNTMPGFTPTSVFPTLWAERGVTYSQIIHELIKGALTRKNGVLGN